MVEADEWTVRCSPLPRASPCTNAELDHHATYASLRDVETVFRAFLELAEDVVLGDGPA